MKPIRSRFSLLFFPVTKNPYWETLKAGKKIFLLAAVAVILSGIAFQYFWPKTYTVTASLLLVNDPSKSLLEEASKANIIATIVSGGAASSSTQQKIINILGSRTLGEMVAEDIQLQKYVDGPDAMMDAGTKAVLGNELASKVSTNTRKQGMVEIRVQYKNADLAYAIAKSYIDNLRKYLSTSTLTMGGRVVVFLEHEMADAKKDLDTAQNQLNDFQAKNHIITAQAALENYEQKYSELLGSLTTAETNRNYLGRYLTEANPALKAEEERLSSLHSQLNTLESTAFKKKTQNQFGKKSNAETSVVLEYLRLEREMMLREAVYETLVKQYYLSKIDSSREDLSFDVLDPPLKPAAPTFPYRPITFVLFFMIGVVVEAILFWMYHLSRPATRKVLPSENFIERPAHSIGNA